MVKTKVKWLNLDEFTSVDYEMLNEDIPINREVKYEIPKPEIPLEEKVECPYVEPVCY